MASALKWLSLVRHYLDADSAILRSLVLRMASLNIYSKTFSNESKFLRLLAVAKNTTKAIQAVTQRWWLG
jgi:hypothetical protein